MPGSSASFFARFCNTLGRALRETGQALDRVGIRGRQLALTKRIVGDDAFLFEDFLSRHRHQMPLLERGRPLVSPEVAYLAPCSTLIGSVRIGAGSSVWYGAILRADLCQNALSFRQPQGQEEIWTLDENRFLPDEDAVARGGGIFIGENSNVQDGCVVTARQDHTTIGDGVTIGHLAQIHSATVEDHSLIGMGSIILEGAVVEEEAFVAGGAVVQPNTTVRSGELWVGNPARKLRDLTQEERAKLHYQAEEYVKVATGQRGVMELGGNLPDTLIEHVMIGAPERQEAGQEPEPAFTSEQVSEDIQALEKPVLSSEQQRPEDIEEFEEEEPLKVESR